MKQNHQIRTSAGGRANQRARSLIEALLREMQNGLRAPEKLESKEWKRLFGDRQNMVANLQKLVQALTVLNDSRGKKHSASADHPEDGVMPLQTMQMLAAWMEEERTAPNA